MKDRIQKRRMPLEWLVVRWADTGERFGLVLNLTLCGAHIRAEKNLAPGDEVDLIIETAAFIEDVPEVRLHAICKWSRPSDEGCFDLGMDITEGISLEDLKTVAEVVYRWSA